MPPSSPGTCRHGLSQLSQSHSAAQQPGFSQAVCIPAGHDLIMIGGQNGVDSSGRVSPTTWLGWLGRRSSNLQICLKECECRS
jgi:hypothetical protein